MEKTAAQDRVILLFDTYSNDSRRLHESFKNARRDVIAVSIEENGFLPEDVNSIYGWFLGDFRKAADSLGRPRYFNEIKVPDLWEIQSTSISGSVRDMQHERARIFFAPPLGKRHVNTVDWLDESGKVRYSDHYNRYGALYSRTTFDAEQKKIFRSYFSAEGKEVIVENFVTQDILLNEEKGVRVFNNKTELAVYFFEQTGLDRHRIFFNSLSFPFFVSCRLKGKEKQDVLFWQEPIRNEIPGNMRMILNGSAARTGRIYVQKHRAYQRLMELGADPQMVQEKGFCYSFRRENQGRPSALICTNSDQIEQCEVLVKALPQMQFHIAALTEMSPKLMAMESYSNVRLYPNVRPRMLDELFDCCDLYLDVNHGNEIVDATQRAFLNNQILFAFTNTLHNEELTDSKNIFAPQNADGMIAALRKLIGGEIAFSDKVAAQRVAAHSEDKNAFWQI